MTIQTQKDIIENILKNNPQARNSDKLLTYLFMKHYIGDISLFIPFSEFKQIPPLANCQKIRQRIQNKEHKYEPTDDKVVMQRQNHQEEMRIELR